MGNEIVCTVHHHGKSLAAKVLLETSELIVRGALRLKIPFASISSLAAADGQLHVRTKDGFTIFELGDQAEKWRERIANPKSLLQKMGPKSGDAVLLIGKFSPEFLRDLKKSGVAFTKEIAASTQWIFLAVNSLSDLSGIKSAAKSMQGAAALWVVYPKGQKSLTEQDVRNSGLKSGLTDVKVARFSETHTALKFVIPKVKR